MITRLYANNFRCLVAFEAAFDSFGVLCGPNGSGKSSVFDALQLIRNLGAGDGLLGGDRDQDISHLEFTNWQKGTPQSTTQEFEVGLTSEGHAFEYLIHIEQKADFEKPRIVKEQATCDRNVLFERDMDGVRFKKSDGTQTGFPLDWRQSALASIQPKGRIGHLPILQAAIANLLILRPNPRSMERESKAELRRPDLYLTGLTSWYRSLSQDLDWTVALRDLLKDVWPDFQSLKLVDVGRNTKALQLRFESSNGTGSGELFFEQLSDGEKALIGLYMVRAALASGATQTVLIDEPDNYVGLPELQPWVLSLREVLDKNHQAIVISHHPEILSSAGEEFGRYLWRDNHTSPTRIGPLKIPSGVSAGEAIARGWVRA
ncbi:MAG: AAA family ATPase [Verrucomicrobia bacterium]|nr:AAA family ATPase [Verrucomicrobiota bacterium]MDE3100316.1 AAA family ATPase [Verrucomicrobiota bacterium]